MKKKKVAVALTVFVMLLTVPPPGYWQRAPALAGMSNPADESHGETLAGIVTIPPETVPLSRSSSIFAVPMPSAEGENVIRNYMAEIDGSNAKNGYIRVRYLQRTDKELRVIIKGPGKTPYIYRLRPDGKYEVFPVSDGSGYYQVTVYENVFDNKYSTVLETVQNIRVDDEFAAFLRPNQYVNYNAGSKVVEKAAELTKNSKSVTDKIEAIYNYVIRNIVYDQHLANNIKAGYIPDVDKVLEKGKGICFDYAAVMTAMLRSQGIPAKLVVGYTGKVYHSWISIYSKETGWVDNVIYLDGKSWKLMDPTFASSGGHSVEILKYIENENNYSAKYFY